MITCDKCGFGHKTFEEKRACKSWDEIAAELKVVPAATQEQPAGSGAKLKPQPYNSEQEVGKSGVGPSVGSPRKVGEDAADLWQRLVDLQLAHETKYSQLPSGQWAWSCACGDSAESFKNWDECHRRTREHWASVIILALRSSSAPVGEQKKGGRE